MIWLSNSAIRYAAAICEERADYSVGIFIRWVTDDDLERKLRSALKNKKATFYEGALVCHADYENGSSIKILITDDTAIGARFNLAIVSPEISQHVIDEIIRPAELQDDRPQPGAARDNIVDDHDPDYDPGIFTWDGIRNNPNLNGVTTTATPINLTADLLNTTLTIPTEHVMIDTRDYTLTAPAQYATINAIEPNQATEEIIDAFNAIRDITFEGTAQFNQITADF